MTLHRVTLPVWEQISHKIEVTILCVFLKDQFKMYELHDRQYTLVLSRVNSDFLLRITHVHLVCSKQQNKS
jgi:hypothetical protein